VRESAALDFSHPRVFGLAPRRWCRGFAAHEFDCSGYKILQCFFFYTNDMLFSRFSSCKQHTRIEGIRVSEQWASKRNVSTNCSLVTRKANFCWHSCWHPLSNCLPAVSKPLEIRALKVGSKGRTRTVKSDSDTWRMPVFPLKLKNNLP
jgi:hypothetical protein